MTTEKCTRQNMKTKGRRTAAQNNNMAANRHKTKAKRETNR